MRAFISYSSEEKRFAGAVKRALENLGIISFLAHEDIHVSEAWKQEIIRELRRTDIFVALLSAKFRASDWCSQEIGFIESRRPEVVVLPLTIDSTIPYGFISDKQGQYIADESTIPAVVGSFLYRARPRELIPIQIERVRAAGSFRDAEAAVEPLVAHFDVFTRDEVAAFAEAADHNYEVWGAGRCISEFLPRFLALRGDEIEDSLRAALKEKIGLTKRSSEPPPAAAVSTSLDY